MNNERMDTEYPKRIDLIELLRGLLRSARHFLLLGILLILAGAFAVGTLSHLRYSPYYEASASFTVRMINPLYADQQYYNKSAAEQMAKTFPQILSSGILSERVKKELNISAMPMVKAESMGNTNVITLKVTAADPRLAHDVLNSVVELYPSVSEFVIGSTAMTLLSESGIPDAPINTPNVARGVVWGALAGITVWAGLATLYWLTHQTVSSEDDLSKLLTCAVLAIYRM